MNLSGEFGRQLSTGKSAEVTDSGSAFHQALPERVIPDADG